MPTFGTQINPGLVVEIPDTTYVDDDGNTRTLRPPADTQLPVKDAGTLADLDPITVSSYGRWEYTTTTTDKILVSTDGGATWSGPFWSKEATDNSMASGANASDALVAAQNAVLLAQAAQTAASVGGSGIEPIVEVSGSPGVYPAPTTSGALWFFGQIEPTLSQGFRDVTYGDMWWPVVVA